MKPKRKKKKKKHKRWVQSISKSVILFRSSLCHGLEVSAHTDRHTRTDGQKGYLERFSGNELIVTLGQCHKTQQPLPPQSPPRFYPLFLSQHPNYTRLSLSPSSSSRSLIPPRAPLLSVSESNRGAERTLLSNRDRVQIPLIGGAQTQKVHAEVRDSRQHILRRILRRNTREERGLANDRGGFLRVKSCWAQR